MDALIIEQTQSNPKIVFDKDNGVFEITGRSLPEDAMGFYQPVLDWLKAYVADPNPTTTLVFELDYFNTASSKVILELIKIFRNAVTSGLNGQIIWCHLEDDDDTLEAGQDFSSIIKFPFTFRVLAS
jgi:hypothetical protein